MRKLFFLVMAGALVLTGCNDKKSTQSLESLAQADSLRKIIEQRDNEINDMMGTLNEIQEGLREITEAENRVSIVKDGEGSNKAQQIKENVSFISNRMKQNRELIKKLQKQLRESSYKGDELRRQWKTSSNSWMRKTSSFSSFVRNLTQRTFISRNLTRR